MPSSLNEILQGNCSHCVWEPKHTTNPNPQHKTGLTNDWLACGTKASQLLISSWNQFWGAIWPLELPSGIRSSSSLSPLPLLPGLSPFPLLLRALRYNHLNRNPCLRFFFQGNGLREASWILKSSADSKDVLLWLVHSSWIILQVGINEDALLMKSGIW